MHRADDSVRRHLDWKNEMQMHTDWSLPSVSDRYDDKQKLYDKVR